MRRGYRSFRHSQSSERSLESRDSRPPLPERQTVANYVSNILARLQVADRKEAARIAREAGLDNAVDH
jgi:hypothetical protein